MANFLASRMLTRTVCSRYWDRRQTRIMSLKFCARNVSGTISAANKPRTWKRGVLWFFAGFVSAIGPLAYIAGDIAEDIQHSERIKSIFGAISTMPIDVSPTPRHNITGQNMDEARQEFLAIVGRAGIDDNPGNLESRSSTEWSRSPVDTYASLILFPQSTLQVSEIMKVCHKRLIPVTGFSGGTSLDGALAATRGGVCIDFRHMNQIIALHERDMDVLVQPAVGWEHLNEYLARSGLFFPPDPGPGAQIGGMIGTGCSGTNAYRYGTMKDWVISTTVVLADGTIVKTRNRPRKSTAGYDLTRLMVGSSGTLGLVTEAVLKVTARPENEQVAVIAFPSTYDAVSTVIDAVQQGLALAALELLDENSMRAVNESGYTTKVWKEVPTLFVKFNGTKHAVKEQVDVVAELAEKHGRKTFESSDDPEEINALWSARKTALWSLIAQKRHPDDKFLGSDVAVPISRLADIIEEIKDVIQRSDLLGATLGHVGDGNFHTSILYGEKDRAVAEKIMSNLQKRAIEMEGTVTGEHGIGLALRDMLEEELGENAVNMMRKIKFALDPLCLLNCDKIIRMEPTSGQGDATKPARK